MSRKMANILAVIGVILIFGAIGYDDTMMITGQSYALVATVRNMFVGFVFLLPRLVYGKKIA